MHVTGVLLQWVSPFGNLRIIGYLLLPEAYRSLSRPSSAPDAKAFPLRSFQLDLSNHLLILKVELCRQFNRIFEIVIVTHLYDVPQLKLKIRSSVLSNKRPLCCLAYHFFITLFSFQGSIFQLLLQPDLKICLYARSSNPTTNVTGMVGPSGLEPPTLRLSVVRSSQLSYGPVQYGLYSVGGDSRDRTGDLLLARQALSQLSYIPKLSSLPADFIACAL